MCLQYQEKFSEQAEYKPGPVRPTGKKRIKWENDIMAKERIVDRQFIPKG